MTFSEVIFWNAVKNGGMMGYDFDRQRPIGDFIVDFYSKDLSLAVEIDGITHDNEEAYKKDKERQEILEKMGVSFLRFNALHVVHDLTNVLRSVEHYILNFEDKYGVMELIDKKRKSR